MLSRDGDTVLVMPAPSCSTHAWGQDREAARCQSQNSLGCFLAAASVQRGHCKQMLAPLHLQSALRACSLPPPPLTPPCVTSPASPMPCLTSPPAHEQHISSQLPGQLSLLPLYSSSQPTPAAALAPAPSPSPAPALPSPPSGPTLTFCPSPRRAPVSKPTGDGDTRAPARRRAAHSLAA